MDSSNRQNLNCPFTESQLRGLLQSDEGRRLMHLLQQNGAALDQATSAAKAGDFAKALECLKPVTSSKEASRLISELNRKHG